jgi:hypothetical protein
MPGVVHPIQKNHRDQFNATGLMGFLHNLLKERIGFSQEKKPPQKIKVMDLPHHYNKWPIMLK